MNAGDWAELQAYRATGLTPEAVQEMVSFPYTADDEEETEMIANQCVICGAEMPEGDQVCRGCRMPRYYVSESTNTILELDKGYAMICGKVFNDVPSLDWLAEAVREKMEREAEK